MKVLHGLPLAAALCLAAGAVPAIADSDVRPLIKYAQDAEFKGAPGEQQTAVLFGDPSKAGLYVIRVKYPAGIKVPPHWHPDEMRNGVVLSGTLYIEYGEQWEDSKFVALPPGAFFYEPPHVPHMTWARDGEVVVQVTGIGPTGGAYISQVKK